MKKTVQTPKKVELRILKNRVKIAVCAVLATAVGCGSSNSPQAQNSKDSKDSKTAPAKARGSVTLSMSGRPLEQYYTNLGNANYYNPPINDAHVLAPLSDHAPIVFEIGSAKLSTWNTALNPGAWVQSPGAATGYWNHKFRGLMGEQNQEFLVRLGNVFDVVGRKFIQSTHISPISEEARVVFLQELPSQTVVSRDRVNQLARNNNFFIYYSSKGTGIAVPLASRAHFRSIHIAHSEIKQNLGLEDGTPEANSVGRISGYSYEVAGSKTLYFSAHVPYGVNTNKFCKVMAASCDYAKKHGHDTARGCVISGDFNTSATEIKTGCEQAGVNAVIHTTPDHVSYSGGLDPNAVVSEHAPQSIVDNPENIDLAVEIIL